jgi:hypothetical protein
MDRNAAPPEASPYLKEKEFLIEYIDHISIIKNADDAARFLPYELELPWVWEHAGFGTFDSYAVVGGNLILECVKPRFEQPAQHVLSLYSHQKIDQIQTELRRRGLVGLEPFIKEDQYPCGWDISTPEIISAVNAWLLKQPDRTGITWAAIGVDEILGPNIGLIVNYMVPEIHASALDLNNARINQKLQEEHSLGWLNVRRLVLQVANQDAVQRKLEMLLNKFSDAYRASACPEIRLIPGEEERFLGMEIAVQSLEKARRFLQRKKLLGKSTDRFVSIDASRFPDFGFVFVEAGCETGPADLPPSIWRT